MKAILAIALLAVVIIPVFTMEMEMSLEEAVRAKKLKCSVVNAKSSAANWPKIGVTCPSGKTVTGGGCEGG